MPVMNDRAAPEGAIRWPARYAPERSAVHVRNELELRAPCGAVWPWLTRAELWPTWYPNSHRVRILSGGGPDLQLGTRFHWWTFGVAVTSEVVECVAGERLAWTALGVGVRAYHAWLLAPVSAGCRVLTEETQCGWLAKLGSVVLPNRMHHHHQIWLERLGRQGAGGPPPPA
jgi:hypothetical protein